MRQNSWQYHTYTRRRLLMKSEPSRFSETEKVYMRAPSLGNRFYISKGYKLSHTNFQQKQLAKGALVRRCQSNSMRNAFTISAEECSAPGPDVVVVVMSTITVVSIVSSLPSLFYTTTSHRDICSAARTNVVFTNSYVDNNSTLISE
jgi:hypothetical protein